MELSMRVVMVGQLGCFREFEGELTLLAGHGTHFSDKKDSLQYMVSLREKRRRLSSSTSSSTSKDLPGQGSFRRYLAPGTGTGTRVPMRGPRNSSVQPGQGSHFSTVGPVTK
eukprot:3075465-Rhodomonas_salina.1